MPPSSHDPDSREAALAKRMKALTGLGFKRVDTAAMDMECHRIEGHRNKVTWSLPSMGTLVSVTAIHESQSLIEDAVARAFSEMERVVGLLNRYDPASALAFLNTEGAIPDPPPELVAVLSKARSYFDATAGAFDATVQPLVDLFRGAAGSTPPSDQRIRDAVSRVDGGKVEVQESGIRLYGEGMGVTLDGIAKGFIVDVMAEILAGAGLRDFLVNAGGDIRSSGAREDGEPWRVGVQDPAKQGDFPDIISMGHGAVATSGSYEIYFDRERVHHHLVSAEDGASPNTSQSVSVVAPTTLAADAMATSIFVMDPEQGMQFIEAFPQCACLIVDEHGRQWRSKEWRSAIHPHKP
jgi:thiamine biosynthesis lipoprotein